MMTRTSLLQFGKVTLASALLIAAAVKVEAQSIHFSQYYNAPMLLNPANTALMPEDDYRVGLNYRNQWATVPVPYSTFSAFADFKTFSSSDGLTTNWLGIGGAVFNDVAGDGNLALTRFEGFAAYHLGVGTYSMLSLGLSGGYAQRSVNYDNLTFDSQWDGFKFNTSQASNEPKGIIKTTYTTIGAGINYAYFPNDNVYMKFGAGVANINQPVESFYGGSNKLGIRPTADVDILFKANDTWILNPSVYFATQKGAYELVYGTMFQVYVGGRQETYPTQLILGIYNRLNESIIGVIGFEWGKVRLTSSYDITISSLAPYNSASGAFELSLIYQGVYGGDKGRRNYNCPRF